MEGFKKPKKSPYRSFLYIDGPEALNLLSDEEGGTREEILTKVAEEGSGGGGIDLSIGAGPARVGGKLDKKRLKRYEEEVRRKSTDQSVVSALLKHLYSEEAIGFIPPNYGSSVYEELEEGDLYEFKASVRLHPLHQLVTLSQGWAEFGENINVDKRELRKVTDIAHQIEKAFHGKDKHKKKLVAFADIDGSSPEYKIVMTIKADQLWVPVEDFSGTRATFIARVERLLGEDERVLAARMVRNAPVLPIERDMMLNTLSALSGLPSAAEIGITVSEDEVLLRYPAITMTPLCAYRG